MLEWWNIGCWLNQKAFENMSKKQVNHLLLLVLASAFLSVGCAHKLVTPYHEASANSPLHKNREITTAKAEQIPSTPSSEDDSGDDFSDDELDLFDDEFEEDKVVVADPLSLWNRGMFHFNDKFYFWVLKPVAKAYRAAVPSTARIGVKNFFTNLTTPIRLVNCILQWKWQAANGEFARFLLNSTVGVLGFGNPAKKYPELNPSKEDLGQTLGAYGIGNGFYVVWPFLGPCTLRDSVGLAGDLFLNPVFYVQPIEAAVGIASYEIVNDTSLKIGDYESLKKAAINPYDALRDAYIQHRKSKVKK
jgi:phospholipid-binding lipoprotein MlaA